MSRGDFYLTASSFFDIIQFMECPHCGKEIPDYLRQSKRKPLLRRNILMRDGNKCVDCGATKRLIIHHLNENRLNNSPENLITVCRICHSLRHGAKIKRPEVIEMKKNGMTFQEIGTKLGVSRQRAYQIYSQQNGNK